MIATGSAVGEVGRRCVHATYANVIYSRQELTAVADSTSLVVTMLEADNVRVIFCANLMGRDQLKNGRTT